MIDMSELKNNWCQQMIRYLSWTETSTEQTQVTDWERKEKDERRKTKEMSYLRVMSLIDLELFDDDDDRHQLWLRDNYRSLLKQ